MNLLVRDANFRNRNRFRYGIGFFVVCFANLAPFLRCIVFIGEPALCLGTTCLLWFVKVSAQYAREVLKKTSVADTKRITNLASRR